MWKGKQKVRILWNREFRIVKEGLDEKQVTPFVQELIAKLKEAEERAKTPTYPGVLDRLAEQTVLQAERLAQELKDQAKEIERRAQEEAARIIAEAQATAREQAESIGAMATAAAEEAQRVLLAARAKAASIEAEGRKQAERLLISAKSQIETQVRRDLKGAEERLLPYLQDVIDEAQALSTELGKWEAPASHLTPRSPAAAAAPVPTQQQPPVAAPAPTQQQPPVAAPVPTQQQPPVAAPVPTQQQPPVAAPAPTQQQPPVAAPVPTQQQPPVAAPAPTQQQPPVAVSSAGGGSADSTPYEGLVQVTIQAPVYPAGLGEVYQELANLPGASVRDIIKTDDGEVILNLWLRSSVPLVRVLNGLENVARVTVQPQVFERSQDGGQKSASRRELNQAPVGTRLLISLKR